MTKYLVFNFPYMFFNLESPYDGKTFFFFQYKNRTANYTFDTKLKDIKRFFREYTEADRYCAY